MSNKNLKNRITKKKSWNISILVIFILLASGIIGILTMYFVRQILHYNGTVLSYYKSYYLAQAGLELSLAQTTYRKIWFEYSVHSWDAIIQENFDCYACNFETTISGNTNYLSKSFLPVETCTEDIAFSLSAGESLVLPLYKDSYKKVSQSNVFWELRTKNLLSLSSRIFIDFVGEQPEEMLVSITTSGEFITLSKKYPDTENNTDLDRNTINEFLQYDGFPSEEGINKRCWSSLKNYLIIWNPSVWEQKLQFCLRTENMDNQRPLLLPTEFSYIRSIGNYGTRSLWLEAIYQHKVLPSFLGHTTLEF